MTKIISNLFLGKLIESIVKQDFCLLVFFSICDRYFLSVAFDYGDINKKMVCRRHIIAYFFSSLTGCYDITIIVYCLNKSFISFFFFLSISFIVINTVYFSVVRMVLFLRVFMSYLCFVFFSCYILPLSFSLLIVFSISRLEKRKCLRKKKHFVLRLTSICTVFVLFNED
jgi:hypothetical protein